MHTQYNTLQHRTVQDNTIHACIQTHIYIQTDLYASMHPYIHTCRLNYIQYIHTYMHTNIQTDRQAGRYT